MTEQTADAPDEFDVIVIGAGPAGENAAARAVQGGLTAVLVERRVLGGECSYWACIPSKALLRPVETVTGGRRLPGITVDLDPSQVLAHRDSFIGGFDDSGQVEWAEGAGITVVRGEGRLVGERLVSVGDRTLRARQAVVLGTGTTPSVPPIEGLREADPWTNEQATTSSEVPQRLVVLGGGVVGVELAQAYAGLGSSVTLVARSGLLDKMEDFAGELVGGALREMGVEVKTGTDVERVDRAEGGEVTVTLGDGSIVKGDEVLVAMGRTPATSSLGLETVGLEPGRYVEVDDSMRATGVDGGWLYAVGDCNGRVLLTHMGKYQARVAGDVIAVRAKGEPDDRPSLRATSDHDAVPQVVFTDPQVASVGATTKTAPAAKVVDYDLGSVSGAALLAKGYTGRARLLVDEAREGGAVVVGATFVGQDVAELLHSATIAIVGGVTLERLWHAVPSFPTISEVWLRFLEAYGL